MKDLFNMGGPLYMGILTVILIILIAWTVYHAIPILTGKDLNALRSRMRIRHIRTIGTFGFTTGILGQMIGLYQAFNAIERAGDVSPALLMGGLKVSMITTIYGFFIFLLSLLLWFVLDNMLSKQID